jgi:hypothetical protein
MMGSRAAAPATGTPRVKRIGSSSSSSAEKELEWPLWGVALRKRRLSNLGASARIASVVSLSTAYLVAEAGAATWASSRMSRPFSARSPRWLRSGPRYSGRRISG